MWETLTSLCSWIVVKLQFYLIASKIRYEITRGNHGGAFAVKNETGAIYVAGPLDYENRKEVKIFWLFKNIILFHVIIEFALIGIRYFEPKS